MQTAPSRSLLSSVKPRMTATGWSSVAPVTNRTHGQRYADGSSESIRAPHADRIAHLRNELALLLMQTREIMERGARILEVENLDADIRRDVLHLCARVDGVLWQMEDMVQLAERTMNRTARGPKKHRGARSGTPMNPF